MRKDCHNCKYDDENYNYEGGFAASPCVSCTSKYDEPPTNWKAKEEVGAEMTPEEAIKELRLFVDHKAYTDDFQDMCRTAIAALEKQIAKEPVIEIEQGMKFRKCPECGRILFSDKYCGDCGQLIKR